MMLLCVVIYFKLIDIVAIYFFNFKDININNDLRLIEIKHEICNLFFNFLNALMSKSNLYTSRDVVIQINKIVEQAHLITTVAVYTSVTQDRNW